MPQCLLYSKAELKPAGARSGGHRGTARAASSQLWQNGLSLQTIRCTELFVFYKINLKVPYFFSWLPDLPLLTLGPLVAGRGSSELTGALFRSSHQSIKLIVGSGRVVVVVVAEW